MRVRMLQTRRGAADELGLDVQLYRVGEVVDLPDHRARLYLEQGAAEQDRVLDGAPETKAPVRGGGRRKSGGAV